MGERRTRTRPAVAIHATGGHTRAPRSGAPADTSSAPAAPSPPATAVDSAAETQRRRTLIAGLALFRDMAAETVERMPLGFVALDHAMCATYANPTALALTGASLDTLVGRRPWDLFPEIVGTQYQAVRRSTPTTIEYEEHFATSDRWAAILACPTEAGISIFLRDISGQKRDEETVRSSVALLHGSLDAMLDACMVCSAERDAQGAIVSFRVDFANVAAGSYLGGPPDKLMGALVPDWQINPRDMPFADACRRVVETGDPCAVDALAYAIAGPEGTSTPGALSLQVARFSDGFFATWRDVTETHRLALERERLAAIVDQVDDGIVAVDAGLRVTYANAAFAGDLGLTRTDLVGRSVLEVVDGILDAPTVAKLTEVARSGRPWLGEGVRRLADGTVGPLQIRATPRRAADGTFEGYMVVARDVAELRRGEADLLASYEKYRTLFEESFDGLFVTSPAGKILDMNCKGVAMFGYDTKEEMLDLDLERDVYAHHSDRERILTLVRDEGAAEFDVVVKRKNGEQMPTHCSMAAVLDEQGAIASYRGIIRDITDRVAEEAEHARLVAALEQTADAVWIKESDGSTITYVNPAFCRLYGYERDEIVGQAASIVHSGRHETAFFDAIWASVAMGKTWAGTIVNRRKDGALIELEAVISGIRDEYGHLISYVQTDRDVTRERELEAEHEREAQVRVALAESLARVPADATLERAAQAICDELVRLPFVDVAAIQIFLGGDDVQILAQGAPPGYPAMAGTHLPPARAAIVRERSGGGPWARFAEERSRPTADCGPRRSSEASRPSPTDRSCMVASSWAPSCSGRSTSGSRACSWSRCRAWSPSAPPRAPCSASGCMPGVRRCELAPRPRRRPSPPGPSTRSSSRSSTSSRRETVGYEALTRFDSGQRPDLCFADAWSVGLGPELELGDARGGRGGREAPAPGPVARPQRLAAPARRPRAPAGDPLGERTGPSCSRSPSTS